MADETNKPVGAIDPLSGGSSVGSAAQASSTSSSDPTQAASKINEKDSVQFSEDVDDLSGGGAPAGLSAPQNPQPGFSNGGVLTPGGFSGPDPGLSIGGVYKSGGE